MNYSLFNSLKRECEKKVNRCSMSNSDVCQEMTQRMVPYREFNSRLSILSGIKYPVDMPRGILLNHFPVSEVTV
jgi:hypothetical protein